MGKRAIFEELILIGFRDSAPIITREEGATTRVDDEGSPVRIDEEIIWKFMNIIESL